MMMKKIYLIVAVASVLLAALSACKEESSPKNLPEVNDTNCTDQIISKIEPKEARTAFANKCFERGHISPTQKPKNWLEFNH
jgi:entry exclusion lipoprotein TrbK